MNDFKIIYRILRYLQLSLDVDDPDMTVIGYKALDMTQAKWSRIMKMLSDAELIDGLSINEMTAQPYPIVNFISATVLTFKGLEYLENNSMMKKAARKLKGVVNARK